MDARLRFPAYNMRGQASGMTEKAGESVNPIMRLLIIPFFGHYA